VRSEVVEDFNRRLPDLDELRLADMDAHGVDMQVLSYTSPGAEAIPDPAAAAALATRINDTLAATVQAHPDRFAGLATLPLQDPDAAVQELRRAVTDLGLHGILVNDHIHGHYLDEPAFRPLWAELEVLGVTLYLHPGAIPADQWRVFEDRPALAGPTWGWTAATGAHALRIIYAGIFDDFPGASLTLGHMGELLPFQMARLDSRYKQSVPFRSLAKLPSQYLLDNVFITTSSVCSHAALLGATAAVGTDRVLFAIDYPYESTAEAVEFLTTAPYAPADLQRIAAGNADRLLRLPPGGSMPPGGSSVPGAAPR
jgi:2,3-dihydroxybenzoate decarboxylase